MSHYDHYPARIDPYAVDLSRLEPVLSRHAGKPTTLSAILGETHSEFGFLPLAALAEIARRTNRPTAVVQRVAWAWMRAQASSRHWVA